MRVRPWERSCGPTTERGKLVSSLNSYQHGKRSRIRRLYQRMVKAKARYCATGSSRDLSEWGEAEDAWRKLRDRIAPIVERLRARRARGLRDGR